MESVSGGRSPEPIRIRDGEPVQVPVRQPGHLGIPGARCWRQGGQPPVLAQSRGPEADEEGPEQGPGPRSHVNRVVQSETPERSRVLSLSVSGVHR